MPSRPLPGTKRPDSHQPALFPSLRILVGEDNELNATLLRELLDRRRHRAQFATDGRAVLALAKTGAFDLLLLDLHMPEMDGFEVARAIRAGELETNRHLPIIALTARSTSRDRELCLAAGMDEFVPKPFEANWLWATVDRLIAAFPPERATRWSVLDPAAIVRAGGGEAAVLEKLCEVLRRNLPERMTSARAAVADSDRGLFARRRTSWGAACRCSRRPQRSSRRRWRTRPGAGRSGVARRCSTAWSRCAPC